MQIDELIDRNQEIIQLKSDKYFQEGQKFIKREENEEQEDRRRSAERRATILFNDVRWAEQWYIVCFILVKMFYNESILFFVT